MFLDDDAASLMMMFIRRAYGAVCVSCVRDDFHADAEQLLETTFRRMPSFAAGQHSMLLSLSTCCCRCSRRVSSLSLPLMDTAFWQRALSGANTTCRLCMSAACSSYVRHFSTPPDFTAKLVEDTVVTCKHQLNQCSIT